MQGAREYHNLIKNAHTRNIGELEKTTLGYVNHGGDAECYRCGNILYITASHARGKTFFIYLIDGENEPFKVYGITGGNPGWTETYGWLHKGTWVKTILQYMRNLEKEIETFNEEIEEIKQERKRKEHKQIEVMVDKFNEMFRR